MKPPYFIGSSSEATISERISNFDGHPLWASACLISDPGLLIGVYRDFIKAGVDILLTNTYQASVEGFKKYFNLNEEESIKLFKKAVACCKEAIEIEKSIGTVDRDREILVFALLGCFGAHLADASEFTGEYIHKYNIEEITAFHRKQIQTQLDAGANGVIIASVAAAEEAFMLSELIKEFPNLKAIITFSCKDDEYLCSGEKFDVIAIKCWELNPTQWMAIGVNCSLPKNIDILISPLLELKIPVCAITLTLKLWDGNENKWKNVQNDYQSYISKWGKVGVKYIGGGCQTDLKTIYEIGTILSKYKLEN